MRIPVHAISEECTNTAIILAAILTLGGCAVGPDYVPPTPLAPASWQHDLFGADMEANAELLAQWWETLGDPVLTDLIGRAVKGNHDVREARSRVVEARARRGIQQAGLFPTLDASGSVEVLRRGEMSSVGGQRELYNVGFDAGWEVDVFGGQRRTVEAASADMEASEADLHDALVTLLGEVALNYVDARTYQARIAVAEANLESQRQTLQLAEWLFQAGLSDELAVQQARYNMENTRSLLPSLRSGLEETQNRIAVLLGEVPGAVRVEFQEQKPIPVPFLEIAVGVPAETLRRRPDVRRAERELAAQTARVGAATAELYPKLSLLGSIGLESLSAGDLFSAGSRAYSVGPTVTWPVFHAGAIRKNIEAESAAQEQALSRYEATVLTALEEVENALVAFASEQDRRQALEEATRAARRSAELSEKQYVAGHVDFSGVLESQRSLLTFQDQLTASEGAVTGNLIRLYKALGGGWSSFGMEEK